MSFRTRRVFRGKTGAGAGGRISPLRRQVVPGWHTGLNGFPQKTCAVFSFRGPRLAPLPPRRDAHQSQAVPRLLRGGRASRHGCSSKCSETRPSSLIRPDWFLTGSNSCHKEAQRIRLTAGRVVIPAAEAAFVHKKQPVALPAKCSLCLNNDDVFFLS
jgi:hypothetical protein